MPLPPPSDHRIPLTDAAAMLRRFQTGAAPGSERGGMFHAKAVLELLGQPGCVGLRYYHARKGDGTAALVLVGVDARGNDMSTGVLLEENWPCPPFCPDPDGLNP